MRAVLDHVAGRVPVIVAATHFASNICGARSRRLTARAETICREFVASLSMGARQFRTNPGLVFGLEGSDLDRFLGAAATALKACEPQPMLTLAFTRPMVQALSEHNRVETGARSGRRGREPAGRARCSPPMRKISWPTSGSATRCLARGPLPGHRHARVPVGEARRSTWSLSQKYGREAFDFDKSRTKPRGAVRWSAV